MKNDQRGMSFFNKHVAMRHSVRHPMTIMRKHLSTLLLGVLVAASAASAETRDVPKLNNPMSVEYLQENLPKSHPRLVFTPSLVDEVKAGIKNDPVLKNMHAAIRLNADAILKQPLLKRTMTGKRLLSVSREMLYRINMLGFIYLVEKDAEILQRIDQEVIAVCRFSDWNPSHFLDVAEMSLAVALALDWTNGRLPNSTIDMAQNALVHKGILAGGRSKPKIVRGDNNWNQVCNGGMIAAAIVLAEVQPELAASTINQALDALPNVLKSYLPDGVYPEGSTYWGYGTSFAVVTAAMRESAFGHDFGHYAYPGFKESATFRSLCNAPSGWYFNFADCGDTRSPNGDVTLAWFAAKSGDGAFFERERFLQPPKQMKKLSRLAGAGMAWLSQYEERGESQIPTAWKGVGANPIVVLKGRPDDPRQYYVGAKGGRATTSHGNMDAGAFVFELSGVRWVVDPGNQSYHALEKTGFNLWGKSQDSQRWTLLTKNNYGHSTLTVNGELFLANQYAPLIDFKDGSAPEATFDLTPVYGENLERATRRFMKDGPSSLVIEDCLEMSDTTEKVTWQLVTTSEVNIREGGADLLNDGKRLRLDILSHPGLKVSIVSLYPPPLKLERRIKGLKRLEIDIPVSLGADRLVDFKVRLSGE